MIPTPFALHFPLLALAASAAHVEGFVGIRTARDGSVLVRELEGGARVRWASGHAPADRRESAGKRTLSLVEGPAEDGARLGEPIAA